MTDTKNSNVAAETSCLEKNRIIAALSYMGILFIVPIILAKDSEFAMYHANQGLWLFIFTTAIGFLYMIPFINCFVGIAFIPILVFMIIGIINALNGKMVPLPGFASLPVLVK